MGGLGLAVLGTGRGGPVQLLLVLEGLAPRLLHWDKAAPGLGCLLLPAAAVPLASRLARGDLTLGSCQLVDCSAHELDAPRGEVLAFQLLYSWGARARLLICWPASGPAHAVDSVFASAGWLERELAEMFGLSYSCKADARNLLLDYAQAGAPLVKTYPCGGGAELSYSALAEGLVLRPSVPAEL